MGTQDMVRHLLEVGHRVVYFGHLEGDLSCPVVTPNTSGMGGYMTAGEQKERWDVDETALKAALVNAGWSGDPPLWIESCGLSASVSFIDNPRGISSMLSHVRYSGPMLAMMVRLKAARACFVADVRAYPRNVEMSDGWPELRPMALLDNWAGEMCTDIAFLRYRRRSVQSRSYSWGYLDWDPANGQDARGMAMVGVSHCHVATGFKKKARRDAWHKLLGDKGELLDRLHGDVAMYGEGWDAMPELHAGREDAFPGTIDWYDVQERLQDARVSPVIAPAPGYITNKAYIVAANGCLPVTAANADHEWDPAGEVIPLGSPLRCKGWPHVYEATRFSDYMRGELLCDLRERMTQDFSVLDAMVDDWEQGLYRRDPEAWWQRYGGYRIER